MLIATKRKQARVIKIKHTETELILETENGKLKCEPLHDGILRIVYTHSDSFQSAQGPGLIPIKNICAWSFIEDVDTIHIKTKKITLIINKKTCAFSYYENVSGRLLVKEPDKNGKSLIPYESYYTVLDENSTVKRILTPDGVKEVVHEANKVFNKILYHAKLEFEWTSDEALYGLGQQEEGILNLRGTRQYIHQANLKIAIPVLLSTKRYGIIMDTYSPLIFNDNAYGSYLYTEACNELEYYFVYGESFDEIIKGYRTVSGKASMLPKWAFGYMLSQERYETQQEILDTVMAYRKRNIPLDCIVLDWQSWEDGMWGQKTFDQMRFPDVKAMTDNLHKNGTHFMISIWPNMNKNCDNYNEMKQEHCLLQNSEIYNAFDEKARTLYWKQADEGLFSKGIDAWWCDSSEPYTPEWNNSVKPEPDQNYLAFHNIARIYMDEVMTNAYPLFHAQGIFEGQRSTTENKRVVNLTRSAYTGQQRYGAILWSGDTSAKWSTLKKQIPAGLNFCASGMPYWTLDIGAFFVKQGEQWFWDGDYENGNTDFGYRELYTRWFQFGTFLPIFRTHGTDTRRDIWHFGEPGGMFYDAMVKFIELRYRFMPYIYSLAGMVTLKDDTIMRLLAFDFIHDTKTYDIKDQYMFGPALMICPVTEPMYYEAESMPLVNIKKTRQVYFPTGSQWYDFWTDEMYAGGQEITAKATLDIIPVYVKTGSILPMAEVSQHSGASSNKEITLMVYPGDNGTFTLYQDEQDNYNYEKGAYTTIDLIWNDEICVLTLAERNGKFVGMQEIIKFIIHIIGKKTIDVLYNGEHQEISF